MRRKLPWLKDRESRPRSDTSPTIPPSKQQPAQITPAASNERSNDKRSSRGREHGMRTDRTPSTSPPPQPPTQEFMRDGLDADDIWVMVEDEFLDTSRLFTQHLHHAEYHRLKRLVRAKNESVLQNMARPVDLRFGMSIEKRKMKESKIKAENQAETLRNLGAKNVEATRNSDDSGDDATPWMFDPQLGGLMAGNAPSSSQQLAKLAGSKSNTRAAAGFQATDQKAPMKSIIDSRSKQAASNKKSTMDGLAQEIQRVAASDEEADSDDLDGPSLQRESSKSVPPSSISRRENENPSQPQRQTSDPLQSQRRSSLKRPLFEEGGSSGSSAIRRSADATNLMPKLQHSPPREEVLGAPSRTSAFSRRVRPSVTSLWTSTEDVSAKDSMPTQNAAVKKRKEETKDGKKSISVDEIPTFLI
ncbi:hypothetical protein IWX49DRAFT_298627 [Phyllosticta citricarpa]|uniref:Uncharacterized protein n=2 Tax=Phyllosticta TaxID=121621 RepID=A0ABR1LIZ7_9PEZI